MRQTLLVGSLILVGLAAFGGATLFPYSEMNLPLGPATLITAGGFVLFALAVVSWAARGRVNLPFWVAPSARLSFRSFSRSFLRSLRSLLRWLNSLLRYSRSLLRPHRNPRSSRSPFPSLERLIPSHRTLPILLAVVALLTSFFSLCREDSLLTLGFLAGLLALYLTVTITARPRDIPYLLGGLCLIAAAVSLYGLYQYLSGLPTPPYWLAPALRGLIRTRVYSTLANPNFLAAWLILAQAAALSLALRRRPLWTWLAGISTATLSAVALLLTYSRGGYIGFAAFLAVILVLLPRRKTALRVLSPYLLLVLAGVLFLPAVTTRLGSALPLHPLPGDTFSSRLFTWTTTLRIIAAHPLLGTGWGTFNAVYSSHRPPGVLRTFALLGVPGSADNDYLQLLAEIGIPGALLLFGGAGRALWETVHRLRSVSLDESWRIPLVAGFVGLALQAFFEVTWYIIAVEVLAAFLLGLLGVAQTKTVYLQVETGGTDLLAESEQRRLLTPSESSKTIAFRARLGLVALGLLLLFLAGLSTRPWQAQGLYENAMNAAAAGAYPAAVATLQQAASIDPWNPRYQDALGDTTALVSPAQAAIFFRRAATLSPADPNPHATLAAFYRAEGQAGAATAQYQAAISLDAYDPYTLTAYAELIAPAHPRTALTDAAYAARLYPLLRQTLASHDKATAYAATEAKKNQALLTGLEKKLATAAPLATRPVFPGEKAPSK